MPQGYLAYFREKTVTRDVSALAVDAIKLRDSVKKLSKTFRMRLPTHPATLWVQRELPGYKAPVTSASSSGACMGLFWKRKLLMKFITQTNRPHCNFQTLCFLIIFPFSNLISQPVIGRDLVWHY